MRRDPAELGGALMPPCVSKELKRSREDALGLPEQPKR